MSKYAVLGLGKFGSTVASELYEAGVEVWAVDINKKLTDKMQAQGLVSSAINADATDEAVLNQLGLHEMDAVIVATCSNIESNITINMLLKKMKVPVIFSKVKDQIHKDILERMGIFNIIFPEKKVGIELARTILHNNILAYTEISKTHSLVEIEIPEQFWGKSLSEAEILAKYGLNVIAIKRKKKVVDENGENQIQFVMNDRPKANDILSTGDSFLLIGLQENVNLFIDKFKRS